MDTVFIAGLFVVIVVAVTFMYCTYKAEYDKHFKDIILDIRRQVAEEEARYDVACNTALADPTDKNISAQKRAGDNCRYWRGVLAQHERVAKEAGLIC
jgi:hypothetical protein